MPLPIRQVDDGNVYDGNVDDGNADEDVDDPGAASGGQVGLGQKLVLCRIFRKLLSELMHDPPVVEHETMPLSLP